MQKHQLDRFGVKPLREGNNWREKFRNKKFSLCGVWKVAQRTPNCPLDKTPDEAVEEYRAKVQRCARGYMAALNACCYCEPCEEMRGGGPTEAGQRFWAATLMDMMK